MDYSEISALVNKYWEGETTLEEEALLRKFFSTHTHSLPADLQEAAPLFQYFEDEAIKEWPAADLPELLPAPLHEIKTGHNGAQVSWSAADPDNIPENQTATRDTLVPLPATTDNRAKIIRVSPWQNWMKYAAVLLMAVGIGYGGKQFLVKQATIQQQLVQKDSFEDPEKAFAETQKALQLLAKNLNKGTSQMQKLSYFDEATEKIEGNN